MTSHSLPIITSLLIIQTLEITSQLQKLINMIQTHFKHPKPGGQNLEGVTNYGLRASKTSKEDSNKVTSK